MSHRPIGPRVQLLTNVNSRLFASRREGAGSTGETVTTRGSAFSNTKCKTNIKNETKLNQLKASVFHFVDAEIVQELLACRSSTQDE